jgi:predicted DNA-binding protein
MRKFLKVGMSEELYNSLQFNANSLDITLSKYCREILKNGYIVNTNNDYSLVVYHLNKIGNNINQIARYANANKSLDIQIYNLLLEVDNYLEVLTNDNNTK